MYFINRWKVPLSFVAFLFLRLFFFLHGQEIITPSSVYTVSTIILHMEISTALETFVTT